MTNLGVDGLQNMFALDGIYTIIRVYKNIHLTMDRRGGLESARGLKLANIPLSTSRVVLYCDFKSSVVLRVNKTMENINNE